MSNFKEKACKLGKYLAPAGIGGALLGIGKICETNYKASKEKPEDRENYKKLNVTMIGTLAAATAVVIAAWCICDVVKYSQNRKADAELEAVKATFGRRKGSDTNDDNNPDSDEDVDDEKKAKQEDMRVKNEISKELGLFNISNREGEPLVNEEQRTTEKVSPRYIIPGVLKEGDRLVLVGTPGSGKSVLAYEIGLAASEGRLPKFVYKGTSAYAPMLVDYYDAELDDDDRRERYGQYKTSPNFVVYKNCKYRTIYYLLRDIWKRCHERSPYRLLILDNIYALMPTMTTEETRIFLDGLDIIQKKLLEAGSHLTLIIITHTTKEVSGIPELKDVAGSAHIGRFAKSVRTLFNCSNGEQVALVSNKIRYDKGYKDNIIMKIINDEYLHPEFVKAVSRLELEKEILKQAGKRTPISSDNPSDIIYEKYVAVTKRLFEYKRNREPDMWMKIEKEFDIKNGSQNYNNWKKKYGEITINEIGDVVFVKDNQEEEES